MLGELSTVAGDLDVNVTDGKTYAIAAALMNRAIPFAFMSGFIGPEDVPESLRHAPFLAKPYRPARIKRILDAIDD